MPCTYRCSRRRFLSAALSLVVWGPLFPTALRPDAAPPQDASAGYAPGAELLIGHITDEHIDASDPNRTRYERLTAVLRTMRTANVDLLLSTGDHTECNDEASYRLYQRVLDEVGGYSRFPRYAVGVPFRPVAGNHDGYGLGTYSQCMGPSQHSFSLGGYRFIGFGGNSTQSVPEAWLEGEMRKSCQYGQPIVLFHHYPPPGWMIGRPDLDMSQASWDKLNALAQRYPVIAYLAGHNHVDRAAAMAPGYTLRTSAGTRTGAGALLALTQGRVNVQPAPSPYVPLIITYPFQYGDGLDYTRTAAAFLRVRARIPVREGQVTQVVFRVDGGPALAMQPQAGSVYYEADLDARRLSGPHALEVTAYHAYGAFATGRHAIVAYFAPAAPSRSVAACGAGTPLPTPRPATAIPTPLPTSRATLVPSATATRTATRTASATAIRTASATPVRTAAPSGRLNLPIAADAWIYAWDVAVNRGRNTWLGVRSGNIGKALVRADLPGFLHGSQIQRAELCLYVASRSNSAGGVLNAYRVLLPWSEDSVSWLVPWVGAGASTPRDSVAAPVGAAALDRVSAWVTLDVTSAVRTWAEGGANHGLLLAYVSGVSTEYRLASREAGATAPYIVVTYAA